MSTTTSESANARWAGEAIPETWQQPLFQETEVDLPSVSDGEEHGEVFTRRWVVELILDMSGYTSDRDLGRAVAVEPSCGSGAFLVPMVERLVESMQTRGQPLKRAHGAIQASDLLQANVDASRQAVVRALGDAGIDEEPAYELAQAWVRRADFLLNPPPEESADVVVGNPPYIRLEAVPRARSEAYRRACSTMGGRADVYVGFYEHGLRALRLGGTLGFICADRWMRNAYGARLRAMATDRWSVDAIVSMTGVDAFEDEVDAYPAITILRAAPQSCGPLLVDATPAFGPSKAREVVALERRRDAAVHPRGNGYRAARLPSWFKGTAGWPHGSPDQLAAIADLESKFPSLEDSATETRVGIGVATGADRVFIVDDPNLVEPERLLRLALPRDIASGEVVWSGKFLVNPWETQGLVDLDDWPRTAEYLKGYQDVLSRRHTAKRGRWHKTIDRVIEGLAGRPKLYLPDFKEAIFPVLDTGHTYPHHNLYWVTSAKWDLRVLGGLLLSDIANLFVAAYSVRMRGGYLRFQAQYLRRIRVPELAAIEPASREALIDAFVRRDRTLATRVALDLFELDALPD